MSGRFPCTRPSSLSTRGVPLDESALSRRLSQLAVCSSPQETESTTFSCSSRRSSTYSSCSSGYSTASSSAYSSRCASFRRGRQPSAMSPEAFEKAIAAVSLLPGCSYSLLRVAREAFAVHRENLRIAVDERAIAGLEDGQRHAGTPRSYLTAAPRPDLQVVEALQEFWSLKMPPHGQDRLQSLGYSGAVLANSTVTYDFAPTSCRSGEHIAFATLPGGACYASLRPAQTKGEARRGAAAIALVNCILNEASPKRLTLAYINRLTSAAKLRQAGKDSLNGQRCRSLTSLSSLPLTPTSDDNRSLASHDSGHVDSSICTSLSDQPKLPRDGYSWQAVDVLHQLLILNCGKTMAEFRSRMTVFQLLQWSGDLQQAQAHGLSCEDVLHAYLTTPLDDKLRHHLARVWSSYEELCPGSITKELQSAKEELELLRLAGSELRLAKEKKDILVLAYAMFRKGGQTHVRPEGWRSSRRRLRRQTSLPTPAECSQLTDFMSTTQQWVSDHVNEDKCSS